MEAHVEQQDSHIRRFIAQKQVDDPRYSVTALAKDVGCARQLIYRVLAGDPEVGKNAFAKIAKATGIPETDIYGDWLAAKGRRPAATAPAN
jgi:hypothetical protein